MATKVWPLSLPSTAGVSGVHRGTNTAKFNGSTSGWTQRILRSTAPSGLSLQSASVATVDGPTDGLEAEITSDGTQPVEWISLPLSAGVTISGTITFNLWAFETAMQNNAAINCAIDRLQPDGTLTQIIKTARTTEVNLTTSAVNNFTGTPTSTVMAKGDRFRVRIFFDDAGTMGSPGPAVFRMNANDGAGTDGDSWISFTETITFDTTTPSGTQLFLTSTTGPAVGSADERELGTSRVGPTQTSTTNTAAGWTSPIQCTATAGGTALEWYTRPLGAFTLAGLVRVNIRASESNAAANAGLRCELAICDSDGTNVTVWASMCIVDSASPGGVLAAGTSETGELTTSDAAVRGWLSGPDTAVANGQRLRFRVYVDDNSATPLVTGHTVAVTWNGTVANTSGDSWIQVGQTLTDAIQVTQAAYRFYDDGTESGSTALGTQSTSYSLSVDSAMFVPKQLRIRLQNGGSVAVPSTDDFTLQFRLNGGAWTNVTSSTLLVKSYPSASLTDGEATTNRLTGGTGSFVAGKVDEADGTIDNVGITGSNFTELVWSLQFDRLNLSNGATVEFRVVGGSALYTYTVTPTATITHTAATLTQAAYRWFADDGSESAATALAAQDTSYAANVLAGDRNVVLRARIQASGSVVVDDWWDYGLQFRLNGGAWTDVTTSSSVARAFNSSNLTDAGATTNRLTGGTGGFNAGEICEDGLIDSLGWAANGFTEVVYTITLRSADLTNGDTVEFRILRNSSAALTYSVTPTITIDNTISGSGSPTLAGNVGYVPGISNWVLWQHTFVGPSGSTPVVVGEYTNSANDGTSSMSVFSIWNANDWLVMVVGYYGPSTTGANEITAPAGFTRDDSLLILDGSSNIDRYYAVFTKRQTSGGNGSTTLSLPSGWQSGSGAIWFASIYVVRGADTALDTAVVHSSEYTAANGNLPALTVNGSDRLAMVLGVVHSLSPSDMGTAPTGWYYSAFNLYNVASSSRQGAIGRYLKNVAANVSAVASNQVAPTTGAYMFFGLVFKPTSTTASGTGTPSTEATTSSGTGTIGVNGSGTPSTAATTASGVGTFKKVTGLHGGGPSTGVVETTTTDTKTAKANARLLLFAYVQENNIGTDAISWQTPTGGGLTYTPITETTRPGWAGDNNFQCSSKAWIADVGGSPTNASITVDAFAGSETGRYNVISLDVIDSEPTLAVVQAVTAAATVNPTSSTAGASVTFAPTTPGNMLVVFFGASADTQAMSAISGWTQEVSQVANGTTEFTQAAVYTKIADGSETTVTVADLGQGTGQYAAIGVELLVTGGRAGTGTPSTAATTASGTGTLGVNGSGTPSTADTTSSGTGTHTAPSFTATGTPSTAATTSTGSGTHTPPAITGTGAPSTADVTATGTATLGVNGSGAPTLADTTSSGTGTHTPPAFTATGSPTLADATSAGTGTHTPPSFTATGAATLADTTSSGVGVHTPPVFTGTGNVTLTDVTATGAGTFTPPAITGTGAPTLANATSTGSGTVTVPGNAGNGSVTLTDVTGTGAGTFTPPAITGTGAASLATVTSAGTGSFTPPAITGAGAATLTSTTSVGGGTFTPAAITGTGAATLAAVTSAGTGIFSGTATTGTFRGWGLPMRG